jgi:hypothetical protein
MKAWRLKMEPWRVYKPEVADSHFDKVQDPDPHQSWIRISIKVKSWIRIRIKVKSWIRICINMKSWIRIWILINVMQIPDPDYAYSQHCREA